MKICETVINDLVTDQRVHRSCSLLYEMGHDVCLIGRKKRNSSFLPKRNYKCVRMKLLFEKGAIFYATFNIRLFLRLLFTKCDAIWANDLDTLLACRLAAKIKSKKLIYDSHEYFTEVPEIQNRKFVKHTWEYIENKIFPKLDFIITVNGSIANLYKKKYNKDIFIVRNVPMTLTNIKIKSREELGLPENKNIIIIQGSGINIDRGAEEAVEAMRYINNAILLIIGSGDVIPILKERISKDKILNEKIIMKDRMSREELYSYTSTADIGLTLDKNTNINYLYSLPNKVFDYMQAGTAILCSDLPEVKKIVTENNCGKIVQKLTPQNIALFINEMLANKLELQKMKDNALNASKKLCWEKESLKLKDELEKYLR